MTQLNPFLENWKRIMATAPSGLKYVRVIRGVATVMSPKVMVRCPVGNDTKDGFYKMIGSENRLIPVTDFHTSSFWSKGYWGDEKYFPDIEQLNPGFDKLKPFCSIDKGSVKNMLALCEHIRRLDGTVMITDSCMTLRQRPNEDLTLTFNFSLPNGEAYVLDPTELKLALIEMLRYDHIFLTRQDSEGTLPIVLGLNWEQCALVQIEKCIQNRIDKTLFGRN